MSSTKENFKTKVSDIDIWSELQRIWSDLVGTTSEPQSTELQGKVKVIHSLNSNVHILPNPQTVAID